MKVIYKFPLPGLDYQEIPMPKDSKIMTVQMQNGTPCIWAVVDTEAPMEHKAFYVLGTGNPIEVPLGAHVGTFQLGDFVGHVFEAAE